jgi:hypothetical protein
MMVLLTCGGRCLHNGGEWTEAKFNSFIKSALRAASRRWPPKYETLNDAYVDRRTNVKSGKLAKHYLCAKCGGFFPAADVQVDHIEAVIDPTVGFVSWDEVIARMFCEKDGLQVLCTCCHKIKTGEEKALAKERRNDAKSKE